MDLLSVTSGACSGISIFLFLPPEVVIRVFCNVDFEFFFLFF